MSAGAHRSMTFAHAINPDLWLGAQFRYGLPLHDILRAEIIIQTETEIGTGDRSGFWHAIVSDPGQSGVIVQIPVTIDEAGNRDRLEALRGA